MLTNPLPPNQNMNSRTVYPSGAFGRNPNLLETVSGHGCINMVNDTNFVTRAKDDGTSQPDLGKEPAPFERSLRIENPSDKRESPPHIPKGVLNHWGHIGTILMPESPKTIQLLRIWAKLLV